MNDLKYWLALNFLSDIGPVLVKRLLSAFGSPENLFGLSMAELRKVEGVGENRAKNIAGFDRWDMIQKEIDDAGMHNIDLIAIDDDRYPDGLRRIAGAPFVLYRKGDFQDSDKYAVSIVGSRKATAYGLKTAERMGYKLASVGLTVVSGMARGIDTAAHEGALRAGGRTIAVLGSGLDIPYPASNCGLMKNIAASGAVISEFPLGTRPLRENFPRRNRIISALSLGVTVIEATLDSGSLITVGYALEQGKDVFAVPGNITSENSKGTNDLIKKGAKLVEHPEEIIDELGAQIKGILREDKSKAADLMSSMTDDEKALFSYLSAEPRHIDSIIREADMTTGKALSTLLHLELKGIVRQSEGKHFFLN